MISVGRLIQLKEIDNQSFLVTRSLEGGMGIVHFLRPMNPLFPSCALKLYKNAENRAQFEKEALTWSSLAFFPFIAEFLSFGYIEGQPYILSRKYERDLSQLKYSAVSPDKSLQLICHCVLGLKYANEQAGLIHKDIKPTNIFLEGVTPKIGDFGLSSHIKIDLKTWNGNSVLRNLPTAGPVGGTIPFMAPELISPNPCYSVQSDIFALGVTLSLWINDGELPYLPLTFQQNEVALTKLQKALRANRQTLLRVIHKSLQLDVQNRYQSYSEILEDIGYASIPNSVAETKDQISNIVTLVQTRRRFKQHNAAIAIVRRMLTHYPNHPLLTNQLAMALREVGETAEAETWLTSLFDSPLSYEQDLYLDPLCNLSLLILAKKKRNSFISLLAPFIESYSNDLRYSSYFEFGIYFLLAGDYSKAFGILSNYYVLGYDNSYASYGLVLAAYRVGKLPYAIEILLSKSKLNSHLLNGIKRLLDQEQDVDDLLCQIEYEVFGSR